MPKKFNYFEAAIRTLLKKYIQRGKVDLFINYEDYTEGNLCLKYNRSLGWGIYGLFQKNGRGIRDPQRYPGFHPFQMSGSPYHGTGSG